MGISLCLHIDSNAVIAAQLCAWYDSCAVLACARFAAIWKPTTELEQDEISDIAGKPSLLKGAPYPPLLQSEMRIWI